MVASCLRPSAVDQLTELASKARFIKFGGVLLRPIKTQTELRLVGVEVQE